jgi:hypothetical protein
MRQSAQCGLGQRLPEGHPDGVDCLASHGAVDELLNRLPRNRRQHRRFGGNRRVHLVRIAGHGFLQWSMQCLAHKIQNGLEGLLRSCPCRGSLPWTTNESEPSYRHEPRCGPKLGPVSGALPVRPEPHPMSRFSMSTTRCSVPRDPLRLVAKGVRRGMRCAAACCRHSQTTKGGAS